MFLSHVNMFLLPGNLWKKIFLFQKSMEDSYSHIFSSKPTGKRWFTKRVNISDTSDSQIDIIAKTLFLHLWF